MICKWYHLKGILFLLLLVSLTQKHEIFKKFNFSYQHLPLSWEGVVFEDKIISLRCPSVWAQRSPNLPPLEYFLWGYLKDSVFSFISYTIDELKQAITA